MSNLDKAREWANSVGIFHPDAQAAIKLIQSLPDQWVDAEKLERIIAGMDCCLTQGSETNFSDGFKEATTTWRDALKALLPPKLPTLADMTREERDECKWAQADMEQHGRGFITCILDDSVQFMKGNGLLITVWEKDYGKVTPLPDLPKLQLPGDGVVDAEIVDETPADQQPNSSETPKSSPQPKMGEWWQVEEERNGKGVGKLVEDAGDYPWLIYLNDGTHDFFKRGSVTPITRMVPEIPAAPDEKTSPDQAVTKDVCNNPRPEDVPADELWLVEFDGNEWVGKRNRGDEDTFTWRVASLGIKGSGMAEDSDMTLIHKLVPETHTLPKGMRLADERTLGRVIVTTEFNEDDICEIVYWNKGLKRNCPGFADESDITFLDGNQ